jgi:hypothetical protein
MNLSDQGEGSGSQFTVSLEASRVISHYLEPRFTFGNSRSVDMQDDSDRDRLDSRLIRCLAYRWCPTSRRYRQLAIPSR